MTLKLVPAPIPVCYELMVRHLCHPRWHSTVSTPLWQGGQQHGQA